jgi:hypothetical protein
VSTRQENKKSAHTARPIRKKRDFEAAAEVAKRLAAQAARDDAAERRLQALLHEMDKFDEAEDDVAEDIDASFEDPAHSRRWSDGSAEDA